MTEIVGVPLGLHRLEYSDKELFHRWLTEEVLQECWHEWGQSCGITGYCKHCGNQLTEDFNRTFDNWNDYGAVVGAMKNKAMLWNFIDWCKNHIVVPITTLLTDVPVFFTTLQEWWEKERKK